MEKAVFNEAYIKSTLRSFCENGNLCGFEAYIVKKESPKLKIMSLDEKVNDDGENFRTVLKKLFFSILTENYLDDTAEYSDGHQLADNQNKYLYFEQSENFFPFKYLDNSDENIQDFKDEDLDEANGLIFKIRKDSKVIWLYQHLWGIMVPNKKKNNLMTRLNKFENKVVFSENKESILTIARKVDIMIIDGYLITKNIGLLQKSFGFHDYIYQAANHTVESIESKNLVENIEKLNDYIARGKAKYAKKMMRIGTSRVLNLSKDELVEKINTLDRWKDKFQINPETKQIKLDTYAEVESLIDLFDERYTRSDVTDTEYDTDVKSIAQPTQ